MEVNLAYAGQNLGANSASLPSLSLSVSFHKLFTVGFTIFVKQKSMTDRLTDFKRDRKTVKKDGDSNRNRKRHG